LHISTCTVEESKHLTPPVFEYCDKMGWNVDIKKEYNLGDIVGDTTLTARCGASDKQIQFGNS